MSVPLQLPENLRSSSVSPIYHCDQLRVWLKRRYGRETTSQRHRYSQVFLDRTLLLFPKRLLPAPRTIHVAADPRDGDVRGTRIPNLLAEHKFTVGGASLTTCVLVAGESVGMAAYGLHGVPATLAVGVFWGRQVLDVFLDDVCDGTGPDLLRHACFCGLPGS